MLLVAFYVLLAAVGGWLVLGLLPAVADPWAGLHAWLHEIGSGRGSLGQMARNAAQASHSERSALQVALDYLFSILSVGLGALLLKLRPYDLTARLLALGMLGGAVAFNLQGHDALQVFPASTVATVDAGHELLHVVSGTAYLWALLLFPDGRLGRTGPIARVLRVPTLVLTTLVVAGFTLVSTDDHVSGLVLTFGLAIPAAGLIAQVGRYRRATEPAERQRSRALLLALLLALLASVPFVALTASKPAASSRTVEYEVQIDQPGTYLFRCDPHPVEMKGLVTVVPDHDASSGLVTLEADGGEFDERRITLTAGMENTIRFTNFDADLHNVAIYHDAAADRPIFIGAEFSGSVPAFIGFRIFRILFAFIPLALIAGLVRLKMWDIDRVVNRTLLYGALVAFITASYVFVVVGIGTLLGSGARLNVALSVAFTAVIATIFQPVRERARRLADRVVYGERSSPYEVVSEFSTSVAAIPAMDELLPKMAELVGRGTGAERADVWLHVDERLIRAASWPSTSEDLAVALDELAGLDLPDSDVFEPVLHRGEILGALSLQRRPGQQPMPSEAPLLRDLAHQASMALRNASLAAELQLRLDELRASRKRIVSAQDEERRRLERDIHDGAQQNLVALSAKIRLAQELAATETARAQDLLKELQSETTTVIESLRNLARGIYPPLLADQGLIAALEAHARNCPVEVRVMATGVDRLGPDIENAVYFCCLEAIQNAVKHAEPPIELHLRQAETMTFEVSDAGPGFDPSYAGRGSGIQNMTDRIAALGGTLEVITREDGHTTVRGELSVRAG